jgi:hypothetical protein
MLNLIDNISAARKNLPIMGLEGSLLSLAKQENRDVATQEIFEEISAGLNPEKLFNYLSDKSSTVVFGSFECSYHPYLNLECAEISEIEPSLNFTKFEHIRCVTQAKTTKGLENEQVVAIFPENFANRVVNFNDPVYYFVNKFSNRHHKFTQPFISKSPIASFLKPVIGIEDHKTYQLIANWVHLHEQAHRTGPMPIPQFLKEKSGKLSAALEELRADLGVMKYCLIEASEESLLTALYVFAERLLAYPLFRERTNFDAISSVIFWKHLREVEFFADQNLMKLLSAVEGLNTVINATEIDSLKISSVKQRREYLNNFVQDYIGDINDQFNNYTSFWEHL